MVRVSYLELCIIYYYEWISFVNFYLQIGLMRCLIVNIKNRVGRCYRSGILQFYRMVLKIMNKINCNFCRNCR